MTTHPNRSTKMRLTTDSIGRVTLAYTDPRDGERVERTFTCPDAGGYVREHDAAGRYPQVCDYLSSMGSTLSAASRSALPALIRGEYRRMMARARREAAAW